MHVSRHRLDGGATRQTGFPRTSTNQASASHLPRSSSMSRPVSRRSRSMTNMKIVDIGIGRRWRVLWLIAPTVVTLAGCTRSTQAAPPPQSIEVTVADVQQRDVPIYGEWIGTLEGLVNADLKAQVTGYLLM